jgi:hypothetical protein
MTTTPTRWKAQSQINTTDGGFQQFDGQVAGSPAGHYFVVWTGVIEGENAIIGRRYDAFGNPAGGEVGIDAFVPGSGHQLEPDIAAMTGGGLAVAYRQTFGDTDIWVRITTPTLGFSRNDAIDTSTQTTFEPAITVFADNSYAVAYTVQVAATESDVVGRIVSNTGVVGPQFDIFNDTDQSGRAELATLTSGNFVAVFQSQFGGSSTNNDVLYRIFSPAGVPLTGPTFIQDGSGPLNEFDPNVAALAGGGFVVVWTDTDASGRGIRAAVINSSGVIIRDNILVNVVTQAGDQNEASVTALADGGFFVTWEDDTANFVRGQRFDPAGNIVGSEVLIKSGIASIDSPGVSLLSDGRLALPSAIQAAATTT